MVDGNLNTTNLLIGVIAAASVLQVLLLVAAGLLGYRLYRQAMQVIHDIEERQIAPLAARVQTLAAKVDGILTDVHSLTGRVARRTQAVDSAIDRTIHRVDETAGRVRSSVASRVSQIVGLVHTARCVLDEFLNGRRTSRAAPERRVS